MKQPALLSQQELDRIRQVVARSMVRWEWLTFSYYKDDHNSVWQVMPVREGVMLDGQPGIQAYTSFHPGSMRRLEQYVLFNLNGMRNVSVMPVQFDARMLPGIPPENASFQEVTGRLAPRPEGTQ